MPLTDLLPPLFLLACAPQVAPITLAAIVQQESGGHWLAIHDNTTGKSYRPATVDKAVLLTRTATKRVIPWMSAPPRSTAPISRD